MTQRIRFPDIARGVMAFLPRLPNAAVAGRAALRSDKQRSESIGTFLERNAELYGPSVALRFEDQVLSHRELDRRVNRVARAFARAGVERGDSVAVFMENRPELLVVVGALAKLGAAAALVNTNQRGKVLVHSLQAAKSRWAVVGDELWEAFAEVRGQVRFADAEHVWWVADTPNACGAEVYAEALDAAALDPALAAERAAELNARSLQLEARSESGERPPWTSAVRIGDPCFYIFTSGTTGLPKASIMSHMRWVKAGHAFGGAMMALKPDECVYAPLPLYHNQALTVGWASAAVNGACLAFRRKFSASEYWDDCRRFGVSALVYIGELPRYLLHRPPAPGDRDHNVRCAVGNGLRSDVWAPFRDRFNIPQIFEIYAASEANTIFLNALNLDETVGICPTPHAIVRYDLERGEVMRDANGYLMHAAVGEPGLLLGKVTERFDFDGYVDDKASEKKLIRDAFEPGDVWFDSGDLLRKIGWGHAAFVDRVGDTFRWKSENVATSEVENAVNGHPQVQESTVYGVKVPGTEGRAGMACLHLNCPPEAFDIDALLRTMREELPPYAVPVFLRIEPSLDVTGTFKHQKTKLRDEGYDCDVPVHVLLPRAEGYVALDNALRAGLAEQRW